MVSYKINKKTRKERKMIRKSKIITMVLVTALVVSAFIAPIYAEFGTVAYSTEIEPTATEVAATNSALISYTALDDPNNIYVSSARKSAQFANISADKLNAYYVTPAESGDPYIDLRIENAGADTSSHSFIGWNDSSKTKYTAGTYLITDFDVYSDWQYISELYIGVISRTSAGKAVGGNGIYFNTFGLEPGEWNHVTMIASVDTNKLYVYVNNTLVHTVSSYGLWNSAADGTQYFEGMRLQVNFAASGTKVVTGQNTIIDNMSVRLNHTDSQIASYYGASSLQGWSENIYDENYSFNTIPDIVKIDGVSYSSLLDATAAIEEGNEVKNVEFLRPYAIPFTINGNCIVNKNGFSVNLVAGNSVTVTENADGTLYYNAPLKSDWTVTPTVAAGDMLSAVKLDRADNIITKVAGTGTSTSVSSGVMTPYVIGNDKLGNDYLVSTSHEVTSSASVYYSLQVMKKVTYNASVQQYIVYDFDLATLTNSDETTGLTINAITRSEDNQTAYFTTGYHLKGYWRNIERGEMRHVTVVYDFNNNKSYMFFNNALIATVNSGVMSDAGYQLFKSGTTINHNELRIMRPFIDFAIDNVCARYITSDSSLSSALSTSSLAGWTNALYTSNYEFPTMAHRATVDGVNIYSEQHLADALSDGEETKNVEILFPTSAPINVNCSAIINTNGFDVTVSAPANAEVTKNQDVITVTIIKGKLSSVEMPAIFQNGMVLQRGESINVYGYCDTEGSLVKVTLAGVEKTAAVADGKWSVTFDAMDAIKGVTLTVEELDTVVPIIHTYTDIAIGDVFILSGQSNMDYYAYNLEDFEEYRLNSDNFDNIRAFVVPNVYANGEDNIGVGEWIKPDSENLKTTKLSAIGYVMATKLATELGDDVTVAIVDATYPGAIIKAWIDSDTYAEFFGENHQDLVTYNAYKNYYEQYGTHPASTSSLPEYIGKGYQKVVASCYDAMMHFMKGYNAKGVVWYQGCGDIGRYNEYQSLFNALATTFRRDFGNDELPIYLIQLAPYGADASELRAVQYDIAKDDENVYLISANTEGTVFTSSDLMNSSVADYFVHTSRKSPIGLRLADSVLKNTYGIAYGTTTAPEIVSVTASGNILTITFDTNLSLLYGNAPEGFEIAGANGVFHEATATISGNTILLTSDEVSAPVTVRYGYGAPIVLILEDGMRIIPADRFAGSTSDTEKATIVDINGNTYVFYADEYDVIMSVLEGNITNASGHPLPVFKLSVGYGV